MSDIIKDARAAFDLAREHEAENRREALDDIRFARLGEQWPAAIRRDRELDGRPCLTINRLPAFIRQVVNDARLNKPSITCHPVDSSADPETAEVFNGLIRNIEQSSDAEVAYDTALDFAVTGGFGYFRINTRYASDEAFDQDLVIERVANPFSIYGDPASTAADSSDWNTAFVVDAMPKAEFAARWKGAEAFDWEADSYGGPADAWREGDQVTVAEYWRREATTRSILALSDGQVVTQDIYEQQKAMFDALGVSVVGRPRQVPSHRVVQRIMSGAEVLETVDWAGKYIPIVPVYGEELHVDGRRRLRSLVRDAKEARDRFAWSLTQSEHRARQQAEREMAEQLMQTGKILASEIDGWSPEVATRLVEYAAAFGVTLGELREVADPRLWKILHRAHLGDEAAKRQETTRQAEQLQAVRPAVQVSGSGGAGGGVRDEMATREWMRRRNDQALRAR